MKIAHSEKVISPAVGTPVAGYAPNDISVRLHDDLKLSVLLLDDGSSKGAVLSFDLLGLDEEFIIKISRDSAEIIGCPPENVIITCTHTHSGPHSRSLMNPPANMEYIEMLYVRVRETVADAVEKWQEVDTYFYSCKCKENCNRRFVDGANQGKYLPLNRSLEPLASEHVDQELGMMIFTAPGSPHPVGVMVNFAAHPLASHASGLGSHQISADYPGVLRDVMEDNSCWCVFVQGAAGDMFPKDSECGFEAARRCANGIAIEVMRGICDAIRNPDKYFMKDPKIRASIETVTLKIRNDKGVRQHIMPCTVGKSELDVRLHLFAIGDICLIGVPGELLCELGQEMKWHSPFRKTFILYNSTAYVSYICHANSFIAGGYEPSNSQFQPFESFKLVVAAVEGMRKLHEPLAEELEA